jgi:hypothetical protein
LWPHYIDDTFPYVDLVQDVDVDDDSNPDSDVISLPSSSPPGVYTLNGTSPLAFSNSPSTAPHSQLPARDVDGLLQFELRYHAFGVKDSDGIEWVIKNGLYHGEDSIPEVDSTKAATGKGTEKGSYILVKFGKGSPEEKQGTTTIAIPIGGS